MPRRPAQTPRELVTVHEVNSNDFCVFRHLIATKHPAVPSYDWKDLQTLPRFAMARVRLKELT